MDDQIPAVVHDYSMENDDIDGRIQNDTHHTLNATMDMNGNLYSSGEYTVIDNEDDEYNDDNDPQHKQEPHVVTWFTFYSHREQREYYYEPISGTTTWIAPSQTVYDTYDVDDDNIIDDKETQYSSSSSSSNVIITNIISRLPGSPILHESIQNHVKYGWAR